MATVDINGVPLVFAVAEFDRLAGQAGAVFGNRVFTSELQALRNLLGRSVPPVQPQEIIYAIDQMPLDKRRKYRAVIDYVAFHYPDLLPGGAGATLVDPRLGSTFAQEYALMQPGDNVDLIYGASSGRGLPPYTGVGARICDRFNNAANIGNGLAFGRQWPGMGELNTSAASATASIVATAGLAGPREGINQATRQAHVSGLMASRLNPVTALEMDRARLTKDLQKTPEQIQAANNLPARDMRIARHQWAHARMVKGVRRACKGGIAMVASAAGYRAVNAKIHFALDALGDLGAAAMKQSLRLTSPYVAITTSELLFCHRYWNDPVFPLSQVVKFYVNGDRVMAPWDGNWRHDDFHGFPVISNHESWRRYELARSLRSVSKPFPAF